MPQTRQNMRIALALCVAASSALAQKSDPAFARLPGPVLRIADSVRIDVKAARLENPMTIYPGPKGSLIVYAQWRNVMAFDSLGRRLWSQRRDERRDNAEIAEVTAVGWNGDQMWVSDAAWTQIALLDQYGNVTKSLELPSWVRPTFANRKSFPVFGSMRVFALYPDGQMLVIPREATVSSGSTGYDPKALYVLRVNEDGVIQRVIAKFPSNFIEGATPKGDKFRFANPLNQSLFRISPDGMRTVLVSVDTTAKQTDTVVVRALNERGDTVFTQKIPYPALRYSETQIDSIGRVQWGNDTEYRERRTKLLPRRAPAVASLALDVDKSVWITLRGTAATKPVVGIDAAGKFIGKFELPARRVVKAANMGRVWVGEARNDQTGDLVRYRITR
jgi:hypothetical protein